MDFNSLAGQAGELLGQHHDKVDAAVDQVGEMAKERFAGHDEHVDMAVDKLKEFLPGGEGEAPAAPPAL